MARIFMIFVFLIAASYSAKAEPLKAASDGSVEQFIWAYVEAFNAKNESRLGTMFTEPFFIVSVDKVRGITDWRDYIDFEAIEKTGWSYSSLDGVNVVYENNGTAAVRADFTRWNKDGRQVLSAQVLYVVVRQKEHWRIASSVVPPNVIPE